MLVYLGSPTNRVAVPAGVLRGIRRAQEAPDVDKYSTFGVIVSASGLGEDEALDWLLMNPLRYLEGVSSGFIEQA
jgi:hypothetical protein